MACQLNKELPSINLTECPQTLTARNKTGEFSITIENGQVFNKGHLWGNVVDSGENWVKFENDTVFGKTQTTLHFFNHPTV
jgi:hypothetical protein